MMKSKYSSDLRSKSPSQHPQQSESLQNSQSSQPYSQNSYQPSRYSENSETSRPYSQNSYQPSRNSETSETSEQNSETSQPYYKKYIPEVVNYFVERYKIK